MKKSCFICSKLFSKRPKEGARDWETRKFCSQECYRVEQRRNPNKGTFKVGNHPKTEFRKGHPKPVNAYSFPSGELHPNWSGKDVGYSGLHMWVRQILGERPPKCEFCGVEGKLNGTRWSIHWANKSHKYLRDASDWIALCRKCHHKYDR